MLPGPPAPLRGRRGHRVKAAARPEIGASGLARNTGLNLLGLGAPLVIALGTIPILVRGLGDGGFGILGLVWMFIALLGEFGFARAGTRFLARALGPSDTAAARSAVRVTLAAQLVLGSVVGLALGLAARPLVDSVFSVDLHLRGQARVALLMVALAAPFLTTGAGLRGFLEAAHRFGPLNVIRGSAGALGYILAALAVSQGQGVVAVVAILLAVRAGMTLALGIAGRDLVRLGTEPVALDAVAPSAREILGFGAWATLSTMLSPVLVYLDRFLLGALVSVTAVGVYTAPYEGITRLFLVPGSVAAALFPAVSLLEGRGSVGEMRGVARRALRMILLSLTPIVLVIAVLAGPGLDLWLGPAATAEGVLALRILAPGVLASALAFVPFSVLQGLGRADVCAKLHLLELPIHLSVAWWLVSRYGIPGAALAWTVRGVLDAGLLFLAVARTTPRARA